MNAFVAWVKSWISWLYGAEKNHEARITALEGKIKNMADAFDTLKADYESFKSDVLAYVASSQQKIADLQAAVAAGDTAKVAALAAEIEADHAGFTAKTVPATP